MAVLFNEKEFEELIIKKGKEQNRLDIALVELEAYQKSGLFEYLYYVYRFLKALKEKNIFYAIRFDDYPSYMIDILELDPIHHFYHVDLQHYKYLRENSDTFCVYIPLGKKAEVLSLFENITHISRLPGDPLSIYFGENDKYRMKVVANTYLDQIQKIDKSLIDQVKYDEKVVNYMLALDDKGYYMPNLYGCAYRKIPSMFYSLMEVAKPKSILDLMRLNALMMNVYGDRKLLVNQLGKYGLKNIIWTRERFYIVLCDNYDLDKERADAIRINLNKIHRLCESDELLLQSNGVPSYIIKQIENIRYLAYAVHAVISVEFLYYLAYIKYYFPDEFRKSVSPLDYKGNVGSFFYINSKIYGLFTPVQEFDYDLRFYDSSISHFDYFNSLGIEGDYGNYPRGRVIFDNYQQKFVVYIDRVLDKQEIKELIIKTFNLDKDTTVFRKDSHYTHDGL